MVVIARVSFPRRRLNQAVTAYMALPPLPPGVSKQGPYFQLGEEQVCAISIFTLPDSDSPAEAVELLRERAKAFTTIPEFSYDIQEWREFREFLSGWME